jgi:NADPH2:quinone reductase
LRARLKELTGGRGIDVVYDPVGGERAEQALRSLAWGGRQLVIGFAAGDIPKLPSNLLLLKSADLLGVFWGSALKADPVHHAANIAELFALYTAGKLHPHIDATYPLVDAVEALQRVMQRRAQGKVILNVEQR